MAGVTLVSGAGGGVGGALASALAQAGHRLALVDVHGAALRAIAQSIGPDRAPGHLAVEADISDPVQVADICGRVERELGPVELLVCAAGIYGERVPFVDSDLHMWWRVLETNLRGPTLLAHQVLPGMIERGRGRIVNINSRAATWDDPGQSSVAYSTSKGALARFTNALDAELRGTGVFVFDVSPGMVRTGMTASRPDLSALPDQAFVPLAAVAQVVVSLASGRYDTLHGRFIHAKDDLDELAHQVDSAPSARRLTLAPTGPDDPIAPGAAP